MKTIIWDWNGTLLDDVDLTIQLNNDIFDRYGYQRMDLEKYRQIFRFPVREYYRDLGVSDENFIPVADAWAGAYYERCVTCPLFADAAQTVRRFHSAGYRQVVLSATRRDLLLRQINMYPQLSGMFDEILGIDDVYADGKIGLAKEYLKSGRLNPKEALFIGDTCHDAEVADAIGVSCVLVSRGHQCEAVLKSAGKTILPTLQAVSDMALRGETTDWRAMMRPLTPEDVDDLMQLQERMANALPNPRWYFTSTRAEWLHDIAQGVVLGIRMNHQLIAIGCAQSGDDHPDHSYAAVLGEDHRHTLDFRDVIVDPAWRRMGIHSAYLSLYYDQAVQSGCRALYATADPENIPSVSSFMKAGYRQVVTQPAYDGRIRTYLKCDIG